MRYFGKMKGKTKSPPSVGLVEIAWSWLGAIVMLVVALLINNIPKNRQYPEFWV